MPYLLELANKYGEDCVGKDIKRKEMLSFKSNMETL